MEDDAVEDSEVEEKSEESDIESSDKVYDAADNTTRNSKTEKKGDLQSTDTEFHAWSCHTKKHVKWDYSVDDVRKTPYDKQKRSLPMNNISVQEWRNLRAAGIF
eukprot:2370553-Ditylum_brightwellii.AAC.1